MAADERPESAGEEGQSEGIGGSADAIGAALPGSRTGDSPRTVEELAILERARRVAETVLAPRAEETDRASGPNRENFQALAEAGFLGLAVPRQYGGLDVSGAVQREYTEILASCCGVTTFIQAQHHGPCRMIASGPNNALKERLLPDLAAGRSEAGISFAHLRRPGPPVLKAQPVAGGYRLNGSAPWVTGWGLIDQLVFGATLPDGRFVYLWSPADRDRFRDLFAGIQPPDGEWGALRASEPLKLCAMNASATVILTCEEWFVPQAHWLSESNRETMRSNDRNGVLGGTALPLGCIAGCLRVLQNTAERRSIPAVARAAGTLRVEWEAAREEVARLTAGAGTPGFFDAAVKVRAWCIELAVRAAHAAVTANSGSANSLDHPAQRLYREAMFYTIQAQTHEVMDATLGRLEARGT